MLKFLSNTSFKAIQQYVIDDTDDKKDTLSSILFEFISRNKIIISLSSLIPNQFYILYMNDALKKTNELTNIIADRYSTYVEMHTNIEYVDFTIRINNNISINCYQIQPNCTKIITGDIAMRLNYQLITVSDLYESVYVAYCSYNPLLFNKWKESKLWLEKYKSTLIIPKRPIFSSVIAITDKLLNVLRNVNDIIIVGPVANLINDKKLRLLYKLQIVSKYPDILIAFIKEKLKDHKFKSDEINLSIPTDFRLRIYRVIIDDNHALDIFNCMSYDIYPYYKTQSLNIGTYEVNFRFILIFIIRIQILYHTLKLTESVSKNVIDHLLFSLSSKYTPSFIYFDGIYVNEIFSKRRIKLSQQFYPYLPVIYKKHNGKYRLL